VVDCGKKEYPMGTIRLKSFEPEFTMAVEKFESFNSRRNTHQALAFAIHFLREKIDEDILKYLLNKFDNKEWGHIFIYLPKETAEKLGIREKLNGSVKLKTRKFLFDQLEMYAQLHFKENLPLKRELIYECSSSSEDGYYVFIVGGTNERGVVYKPGVYIIPDCIGGGGPIDPSHKATLHDLENWIFSYAEGNFTENTLSFLAMH
jgi:hypothetical protein